MYQWLKSYKEQEQQISYLKWSLTKSELELERWVYGDLATLNIEKNSRSSILEKNIKRMNQEIERLEQNKRAVKQFIDNLEGIENEIVKLKYIDGMTLEEIAQTTKYSFSYIRQKHSNIRKLTSLVNEYKNE